MLGYREVTRETHELTKFALQRSATTLPAQIASDDSSAPRAFARTDRQAGNWIGWAPLVLLPGLLFWARALLLPWVFMWVLAAAVFAGCKWQTWWQARDARRRAQSWTRSAAYLLLWPGMDAQAFLAGTSWKPRIPAMEWFAAVAKTLGGIALIRAAGRLISGGYPVAGGWTGMVGLILVLHFGTFHLIALVWQRAGLTAKPIMQRPLASRSLGELWSKRWNLGFRNLWHAWVFQPLQKRFGVRVATLGAFLASGLLHDLVVSAPAGAGYGLPTAYFLTQGVGVLFERSRMATRFGLCQGARGRAWTLLVAAGPAYALFHPWFVARVIVPFLRAVAG